MNTTKKIHNPSDIYEYWLDTLLEQNPHYWTRSSQITKRKREFVYREKNLKSESEDMEVISFARWLRIVKLYYLLARKDVIEGKTVHLGYRLGRIRARTVSRNFKNKKINWAETRKQPLVEDPITGGFKRERTIYHTSETYSRIGWERLRAIPNEGIYRFVPSQGKKVGFKHDFKTALKNNPLLQTQYKQFINELIPLD